MYIALSIHCLFAQEGWTIVRGNQLDRNHAVMFSDSLNGAIIGSEVLRTQNGGKDWVPTYSYQSNSFAVAVRDSVTWFRGGTAWKIEKTMNAGKDWVLKHTDWRGQNPMSIQALHFDQQGQGWAVGGNYVLRSSDSGENWYFHDSSNFPFWNIRFNKKKGIIIGEYHSILISYDGGDHWYKKTIPAPAYKGVYIKDTSNILIGGYDGIVLYSTNGGEDWIEVNNNLQYKHIVSFFFITENIGWAIGSNGLIMYSHNGGKSWVEQNSKTLAALRSMFFMDSVKGWVVGDSGIVLSTTSGGVVTTVSNRMIDQFTRFDVVQNYPNPFNPATTIRFSIPGPMHVTLKVHDCLGRVIETLVDEQKSIGVHSAGFNGSDYGSGVYFYSLTAGGSTAIKKMTLVK